MPASFSTVQLVVLASVNAMHPYVGCSTSSVDHKKACSKEDTICWIRLLGEDGVHTHIDAYKRIWTLCGVKVGEGIQQMGYALSTRST